LNAFVKDTPRTPVGCGEGTGEGSGEVSDLLTPGEARGTLHYPITPSQMKKAHSKRKKLGEKKTAG